MHVTFRQLRLFLALAETGSVSRAAASMHVTQPTASAQLKEITLSVGLPLYEVIGKRVHLTDAGRELALAARAMTGEWDAFTQRVDQMKGLSRGHLRVAAVSTAKYFIPRLIGSFCRAHPAIEVSLEVLNRDGVLARLKENRDDIYVMSMPPEGMDLEDDVFMENPLVVIAARGAKFGARLALADLKGQRFILRETGSGTRMATDRHFARRRFKPDIRLALGSNEAIKEAVAGGLGIGVISRHALQGGKDIKVLAVEGFPISSRWHVVHPRAKQLSPIAAAFRAHLLARAGHP
ncbi:LysR family transcriptional regulator [Aestuariivirga sp.]|uniref:LysR family transcriptional regulator n=1 Tax=Aestuariivirga sp. TaxID=2650926 RepID=UPI003BAC8AC1